MMPDLTCQDGYFTLTYINRHKYIPLMALLCDLGVNLQDYLCGIHLVCLRAIP